MAGGAWPHPALDNTVSGKAGRRYWGVKMEAFVYKALVYTEKSLFVLISTS